MGLVRQRIGGESARRDPTKGHSWHRPRVAPAIYPQPLRVAVQVCKPEPQENCVPSLVKLTVSDKVPVAVVPEKWPMIVRCPVEGSSSTLPVYGMSMVKLPSAVTGII